MVHIYIGLLVIKMNEIMPFETTWMDLEIIIPGEVSQKEKEFLQDIAYMWNLKININEPIYETETWTENRLVVAMRNRWSGRLGLADISLQGG